MTHEDTKKVSELLNSIDDLSAADTSQTQQDLMALVEEDNAPARSSVTLVLVPSEHGTPSLVITLDHDDEPVDD